MHKLGELKKLLNVHGCIGSTLENFYRTAKKLIRNSPCLILCFFKRKIRVWGVLSYITFNG